SERGNSGAARSLAQWPEFAMQRCTTHKLRNLLAKAPAHLREEMAEDYRRMVYGETRAAVEHARASFLRKWRRRRKAVVSSFEEAGDQSPESHATGDPRVLGAPPICS